MRREEANKENTPKDVLKHDFKQCGAVTHCWATERGSVESLIVHTMGLSQMEKLSAATDLQGRIGKEIFYEVFMKL